jgi:WD40 repeat protein
MKHVLIFNLFISTNLTGMLTTNFAKKTTDDIYNIMALVEQNKKPDKLGLTGFFRKSYADNLFSIKITPREWLNDIVNAQHTYLLLCKQFLPIYKKCITHVLPFDICKHIDITYAQLWNKEIKKSFITTTLGPVEFSNTPNLTISNDGHYFTHDIPLTVHDDKFKLMNREHNTIHHINSEYNKPVYFSPNNEYCIIKDNTETYFYNFFTDQLTSLIEKETQQCFGITISNDSQYILFEGRDKISQSVPIYKLWSLDAQGIPEQIPLKDDLYHSMIVMFHPDSKHIIHNAYKDKLYLYNLETSDNKKITSKHNKDVFCIDKLTFNRNNTRILAETDLREYGNYGLTVFNIEDLNNVTSITLPPQSCHKEKNIPAMCIPHKNMLTHITNEGRTLELLDENSQVITAHYAKEKTYITTLAVDNSGNYLAAGHSDGTIMIWNIFSSNPTEYEKIFMKSNGTITSLTFSDNQLLLSASDKFENLGIERYTKCGNVILWDVYGNQIINFGDNIVNSIISPNGKTIIITSQGFNSISRHYNITLLQYTLNKKALKNTQIKELTLAQLSMLMNEWNKTT